MLYTRKMRRTKPFYVKSRPRFCCALVLLLLLLLNDFVQSSSHDNAEERSPQPDQTQDPNNDDIGEVSEQGTIIGARGGTELLSEALERLLPTVLQDRFHITKSRVRQLHPHKKNILWIHDLPDDPENQHFHDPNSHKRFDKIVFVSEWQRQQFVQYFGAPNFVTSVVIRNAIVPLPMRPQATNDEKEGPTRLIYHTTPHRGLEILIPVFFALHKHYMEQDGTINITLDVYSSFDIYGWGHRDKPYQPLFEMCRQHPACNYHGSVPNEQIREALQHSHLFAYPSVWLETSCLAAMEAISAGCDIVAPKLGGLPETLGHLGILYNVTNPQQHAEVFQEHLQHVIDNFWRPENNFKRKQQQIVAAQSYDWGFFGLGGRIEQWIHLLASMEEDLSGLTVPERNSFDSDSSYAQALTIAGRVAELRGDLTQAVALYKPVYSFDKTYSHWLIAFGNALLMMGTNQQLTSSTAEKGTQMLEYAITNTTSDSIHPPISRDSSVVIHVGARLAFYYAQLYKDERSFYWLNLITASKYPHDDCWQIFQATQVPHLPASPEEEQQRIQTYHKNVDELLYHRHDLFCQDASVVGSVFPVAYYDLSFREELSKFTKLLSKAFPWLNYVAPELTYDEEPAVDVKCAQGKIKIGVVSSFLEPTSSIWGSFGMTMRFLQTHPWMDLSLIYYPREKILPEYQFLSINPQSNIYLDKIHKADPGSLSRNREKIVEAKFDVILYLDLFMTIELHQLALAKLAPVQITTHGHPVTSGVRREIMDYYLSWEAAELPDKDAAQQFYTEKLVLIPQNVTWEYYEPRTSPQETSIAGNVPFGQYTRENLDFIPTDRDWKLLMNPNAVWYFCSQASFKFHIDFDKALGKIQQLDSNGVIILIQQLDHLDQLYKRTRNRFIDLGTVDLDRVVFVPRLKHGQLMAMYKFSDVTLDSFYFGGDTTTREAFEVGAPVITLPHKTIGQRWTQAYYKRMGITDFIAKDPDDYARIAVQVGNRSKSDKKRLRKRIKDAAHSKLFRSHEGYPEWAAALIGMATRPRRWHWKDAARAPKGQVKVKPLPSIVSGKQQQQQHSDEL